MDASPQYLLDDPFGDLWRWLWCMVHGYNSMGRGLIGGWTHPPNTCLTIFLVTRGGGSGAWCMALIQWVRGRSAVGRITLKLDDSFFGFSCLRLHVRRRRSSPHLSLGVGRLALYRPGFHTALGLSSLCSILRDGAAIFVISLAVL